MGLVCFPFSACSPVREGDWILDIRLATKPLTGQSCAGPNQLR